MNPLENIFSSDIVSFLCGYFLNESEVLYLNGNIKQISYFVTFLCQVGDLETLKTLNLIITEKLASIACESGSIDVVKWIHQRKGTFPLNICLKKAAENGHIHILKYLLSEFSGYRTHLTSQIFTEAVRQPNLYLLEWLKAQGCPMSAYTFTCAAGAGHIHVLEWLYQNNCLFNESTFEAAAMLKNENILKWLKDHHCPWNSNVFLYCLDMKNINILKWLKDHNCPWNPKNTYASEIVNYPTRDCLEIFQWLADNGYTFHEFSFQFTGTSDLEALKWLSKNNYKLTYTFERAIANGADRNVLQWILDHGAVLNQSTIMYAIQSQSIDVLEWLLSLGCMISKGCTMAAVTHKRLDVLKWLIGQGATDYDCNTFSYAVETGNIEILECLKQNHCAFSLTTFLHTQNSSIEVLEWLRRNGCKLSRFAAPSVHVAWQHFTLEKIEWFQKQMNPLGNVFSHDVIHFLSRYFLDEDEVLYFNGNFKKIKFFLTFLCKVGDLDLLRSLHPKIDDSLIDIACRYGNLEIITWIQSRGGRVGRSSFQHAAESRNVNILEWLKKCNCPMNSSTLLLVVRQPNNLLVLEWFKKVECPMSLEIFVSAVQNKHSNVLSVLEWLRKNNCPWGEQVFAIAAQYANLNVLEWLLKNGCPWNHQTFSFAIQTGDLERLKWLKENGCLHLSDVYYWASQISSIPKRDKVLKWLIINQFPYHENTLYHSTTGDFNFVSFMYQHGFRFPREIIGYAAADVTNDLSVLQWILDHGGKISDHAITYAAKSGRIDVLEWLKEHNFPMNSVAYLYAIQNGHFETLKWLRKHNVQILYSHDLFGAAADLRKIPVLEWLKEEKCMFSETTLIRAAATRDITILEWFRLNGCKTNSRVNVSVWFQHLSLEIIEWFESHPEILNCY